MTRARNSANLASHGNLFVDIANDRTGIGSVAPGQSLHVAGTAGFHGDVTFTGDNYNATWDRSLNCLKFVDNARIRIGTDNDLQLYHNGSHSYIVESGTGSLLIQSNDQVALQTTSGENMVTAAANGAVQLMYDHNSKFQTTAYGTNTTGTAVNDGLVVAGVATVTTMNVTGVLTYDDVTSVDSVGIVTARQGVRVPNGSATTNYISVGNSDILRFWGTTHSYADIRSGTLHFRNNALQNIFEVQQDKDIFFYGNTYFQDARFDQTVTIADTITHHGDTDTKIRFPAADTITAETGGSERLRIDSSGRVLIGTTTEGLGTYGEDLTIASSDHAGITIRTGTGHKGTVYFSDGTSGDSEYKGSIQYDHSDDTLRLAAGGSVRLRIDSSGNVLVGTTDSTIYNQSSGEGIVLRGGDVIDIARSGDLQLTLNRMSNEGANIALYQDGGFKATIGTKGGGIYFGTSGDTERLRITSGGQVNIGSNLTQTTYVCEVAGAYNKDGMRIVSGAPNYQDPFVVASSTGGERFRIKGDGKIYVGSDNTNFSDVGTFFNLRNNTYGGRIGFSNNTATAGVTLMEQFSYWGTNKVAGFIALAGTDTSNKDDGLLAFYTKESGQTLAERLRITSVGDVGIGYNSPNVKLHVREGSSSASSYDNRYHIICESSGEAYLGFYVPSNQYAGIRFTDNTGLEGYIDYYFGTDEMVYSSTLIHKWTTAGSERLRIDSNGAIGIAGANYGTSGQVLTSGGSGSAVSWTTITGTTINNNANNRLITGSGTANTLEGESNLTFNGTGELLIGGTDDNKLKFTGSSNPYIRFQEGTTNKAFIQWNASGYLELFNHEDSSSIRIKDDLRFSTDGFSSSHKIWHAGNDGVGSGLDADLLDGYSGGSYVRSDADDTVTHRIAFQNNNTDNEDTIATSTGSQGGIEIYNQGSGNDAFMAFHTGGDFACYFGLDGDTNDISVGGWSMGANKYRIWHSGNVTSLDGSGSGLDADLLDGLHSGSFLRSDTDDAVTDYQHKIQYYSNSAIPTSSGSQTSLEVYSANGAGTDAFMAFHVSGDFACYFGLDGGTNDIAVGGWSMGSASHKVWHAGNDGSGSGLDADTLDGTQKSGFVLDNTNNAHMLRFGSGGNSGYAADSQAYGIFQEAGAWNYAGGSAGFPDLRINYHTGIVLAAHENYGGVRFQRDYNDTTELFSVGNADDHVRVAYNLYVGDALTIDNAFTLNQSNNNRNMKFRAGGGSDIGISGYDSGNNWCFQLYGTTNGYYGFLTHNWGSWDIKKQSNGDMHLRISGSDYKVLTTKDFPSKGTNISATGGSTSTYDNHKIHDFTSNGTFEITAGAGEVEVLIVAGGGSEGGGGSGCHGGGGGGGGGVVNRFVTLGIGKYSIVIGGGGGHRNNGGNSTAFGFTALGGGAGGPTLSGNGNSGGSGGGGSRHDNNNMGGSATQPGSASGGLGNAGGRTGPSNTSPGGGGGAGGAGANGNSGGAGGPGKQFTQFNTNIYFGAGGSSGGQANGAANTGQGGGGSPGGGPRYSGGSGRVMIRYPV